MKTFTACMVALAITLPTVARANTNWYMLDMKTSVCELAAPFAARHNFPSGASPDLLQSAMRRDGIFKSIEITRDDAGSPAMVVITSNKNLGIYFFSSLKLCTVARTYFMDAGELGTAEELK